MTKLNSEAPSATPSNGADDQSVTSLDVLVVGAGFAGVYAVYRYRQQGLSMLCVEAAGDVGGVWYHNRYPGARCDVQSFDYSYSFSPELDQEWIWSERYAPQPEILEYIRHVVTRFDLRRDMVFNTRVTAARWDDKIARWLVETNTGRRFSCRFMVLATGALSAPKDPDFEGLKDFKGQWYQTSRYPHEPVSFEGKRVGVIGTGSSGLQSIPVIAETAQSLTVFQRTAVFSSPALNGPIPPEIHTAQRAGYPEYRARLKKSVGAVNLPAGAHSAFELDEAEREQVLEASWNNGFLGMSGTFTDSSTDLAANAIVVDFIHRKIRSIVKDPETAESLCPKDHPVGSRRPCVDTNYYETYNKPHVTLADLKKDPIVRITPDGIATRDKNYPLDIIIFALGFDSICGSQIRIDIRNGEGLSLDESWADAPLTYLGYLTPGFPNLFFVMGPGNPSVIANCVTMAETDIDWIGECIAWLADNGKSRIEADEKTAINWMQIVSDIAEKTLYVKANSWYMGSNIAGKPRRFLSYLGGYPTFVEISKRSAKEGYSGFKVT
jgi:cation diffusion facilitator CzcD-associated flavoprotein CzcO